MTPEIVERFSEAAGLPIYSARGGGERVGRTGEAIRFLEFNKKLPGAPARVRSGGVTGYVLLPELSATRTEFVDMIAGILQVFRGDWDAAVRSFTSVLDNSRTRLPLRVDALLYRGMAKTRGGSDGRSDFEEAARLAPYDETVVRYRVMGELAAGGNDPAFVAKLLVDNDFLFSPEDPWIRQVITWARSTSAR